LWKRAIVVGTAVAASGVWVAASAPNAHAAGGDVIALAGSDAADFVMRDALAGTGAVNIPSQGHITGDVTVPGDSFCNSVTYNATGTGTDASGNPKIIAPNGASTGQAALDGSIAKTYPGPFAYTGIASAVGGCVDIARLASRSATPGDESYAYAVDAVGWGSPSLNAPASLTLQDLKDIYNCNINDWGQVPGGTPGPIVRALPPFGGGTRKYFINNVLGISTETNSVAWNPPNSGVIPAGHPGAGTAVTCPSVVITPEQSNGENLLSASLRADYQKYITMYDAGNWVAQANGAGNPTLDLRGGVRLGGIIGVAPSGTFPPAYPVRWTGTTWRLNDGQILGSNETGARPVANVNSSGQFASTITGVPGTFVAGDVGFNVQGSFINDGTIITSVSADGSSATIVPGAKSAAVNLPITIGWAIVSEKNPNVPLASTGLGSQYPGVRFLYNAIHPNEPDYVAARNLIGFDDTTANGTVSALCNGSDAGIISSDGLLALSSIDPTGPGVGNDQPVTCRKQ
jgi:ABC-type phosphate transport system substrate-binding protein